MSHDSCSTGTFRVLTLASLQRMKLEALIPAPSDGEVRSIIKFLNAESIVPIEVHRQLCQQISHSLLHKILTEYLLFRKLCPQMGAKATDTRTQSKALGVSIDKQLWSIFSYATRNYCPINVSVSRMTERRRSVSHNTPVPIPSNRLWRGNSAGNGIASSSQFLMFLLIVMVYLK